ncbi:MAG: hypothetical protein ACRDTE_26110, partial [Pseudonocardiaceae bacterium]
PKQAIPAVADRDRRIGALRWCAAAVLVGVDGGLTRRDLSGGPLLSAWTILGVAGAEPVPARVVTGG